MISSVESRSVEMNVIQDELDKEPDTPRSLVGLSIRPIGLAAASLFSKSASCEQMNVAKISPCVTQVGSQNLNE